MLLPFSLCKNEQALVFLAFARICMLRNMQTMNNYEDDIELEPCCNNYIIRFRTIFPCFSARALNCAAPEAT